MKITTPSERQGLWRDNNGLSAVDPNWYLSWKQSAQWINDNSQCGTDRPVTGLYAGRMYFDASLGVNGKPIWRNKDNTGWIDATGAIV